MFIVAQPKNNNDNNTKRLILKCNLNLKNTSTSIFIIIYGIDETMSLAFLELRVFFPMFSCVHALFLSPSIISWCIFDWFSIQHFMHNRVRQQWITWRLGHDTLIDLDVVKSNRFLLKTKCSRKDGLVLFLDPCMHLRHFGAKIQWIQRTTPIRPTAMKRQDTIRCHECKWTSLIIVRRWRDGEHSMYNCTRNPPVNFWTGYLLTFQSRIRFNPDMNSFIWLLLQCVVLAVAIAVVSSPLLSVLFWLLVSCMRFRLIFGCAGRCVSLIFCSYTFYSRYFSIISGFVSAVLMNGSVFIS